MHKKLIAAFTLTVLAMVAFAGNSILTRLALSPVSGEPQIDPYLFTTVRLVSGAGALLGLLLLRDRGSCRRLRFSGAGALALSVYGFCFTLAYLQLDTGLGALLLFAAVQFTMIGVATLRGERLTPASLLGVVIALIGTVVLLNPASNAPTPGSSAALMIAAGMAWGIYSLLGRSAADPLASTAGNFMATLPMTAGVWLVLQPTAHFTAYGLCLALLAGALTSGVGYAIWYRAVKALTATAAASVQLSVPLLAALGGLLFLNEALTLRLVIAGVIVLGGIALVLRTPAVDDAKTGTAE